MQITVLIALFLEIKESVSLEINLQTNIKLFSLGDSMYNMCVHTDLLHRNPVHFLYMFATTSDKLDIIFVHWYAIQIHNSQ